MKTAIVRIRGVGPLSQSRFHNTPKLNDKELADDYERRTWREKMHVTDDGCVKIPALAFKNCLSEAAKFLSVQIPGKGKSTYTKHFEAGVLVIDDSRLAVKKEEVAENWMFVPVSGVRGDGKRVMRCYPLIKPGWEATVCFYIFDDMITEDVFLYHLKQAGQLIGIGTFRVRNNGTFGRFKVLSLEWKEMELEEIGEAA